MTKALIIGNGKIGGTVAYLLHHQGQYEVTVADVHAGLLAAAELDGLQTLVLDVKDPTALASAMQDKDLVLSACPYFLNIAIAQAAAETDTHYFDLTEDVETTNAIRKIAANASVSFMPQCGLAPGFISIAAFDMTREFEELHAVKLRVGALPQFPTNRLKYNLTWSTDGLINEYCNPCDAIVHGSRIQVVPLEGYERFSLEGVEYEAFNTSGGLSALAEILTGKVRELDYKTARYPGHRDLMKFLLFELGFAKNKAAFKALLDDNIPFAPQDMVLVFIAVTGKVKGRLTEKIFTRRIYNQKINGKDFTAIQVTTAGCACGVIDLHVQGKLPGTGFVRQEDVNLADLMSSDFVRFYQ